MVRTQISINPELYEQAKALAARRGISFAELCRRSLGQTVAALASKRPWTCYIGILDGQPDDSGSVDEVVYGREAP